MLFTRNRYAMRRQMEASECWPKYCMWSHKKHGNAFTSNGISFVSTKKCPQSRFVYWTIFMKQQICESPCHVVCREFGASIKQEQVLMNVWLDKQTKTLIPGASSAQTLVLSPQALMWDIIKMDPALVSCASKIENRICCLVDYLKPSQQMFSHTPHKLVCEAP